MAKEEIENGSTSKVFMREADKLKERYRTVEEEEDDCDEEAWDDASGAPLDPQEVKKGKTRGD